MTLKPSHPRTLILSITSFALIGLLSHVVEAGTPRLQRTVPPGAQRGTSVEVQLQGRYLEKPEEVMLYEPGITIESVTMLDEIDAGNGRKAKVDAGTRVLVKMKIAEDCELGVHGLRLRTASGISEFVRFNVGPFPVIDEAEANPRDGRNDKRETAQLVPLNSTVLGRMIEPTDVDMFRIEAKQGQRLSAEIEAVRLGTESGIPDLHIAVLDADGKRMIAADDSALFLQDPVVSLVAPQDGNYFIEVRHSTYSAANDVYRLHIGTFARPTGLYPAGGQAGQELAVQIIGDPKGSWTQTVKLPVVQSASLPTSTDFRFVAIDYE